MRSHQLLPIARLVQIAALACALLLGGAARADISRYSQVKVVPVKGKGADAGQVVGFKLRLVLHSESPTHKTAWVGLVSDKQGLLSFTLPGQAAGKSALYTLKSGHWHAHWTVGGLKQGQPSEQEFTVLYKDHPNLVPGKKYQLAATFPLDGDPDNVWKHSFGADWGSNWGEPSIELPK
jgi:hypothetical protein